MRIFVLKIFRKFWSTLQIPTPRDVSGIKLWLPPEHILPKYKKKYPLYDEFLPVLAVKLPVGSCVIDIGANVGDTCLSMYKTNSNLHFICVEPDLKFFQYLKFNTRKIPPNNVRNVKLMITSLKGSFKLSGGGGTKSMRKSRVIKMKKSSLDDLLEQEKPKSIISLLKTDIDGYDYDVILSGKESISRIKPLIYSEFMFRDITSIDKYLKSVFFLIGVGYTHAYLFRNTGEFEISMDVSELEEYLRLNVDSFNQFSKVSYFDILLTPENYIETVESAIKIYKERCI
jgi:FkbM family methyltransferase